MKTMTCRELGGRCDERLSPRIVERNGEGDGQSGECKPTDVAKQMAIHNKPSRMGKRDEA
jgi:hypothetical protein